MSELRGYGSGGTVHPWSSTTRSASPRAPDLHSTHFATDVAKGVEAPILHANGDFPAVLRGARVAVDYTQTFGGDSVIDMICYRRWGHSEGDRQARPAAALANRQMRTVTPPRTTCACRSGGTLAETEAQSISDAVDEELRIALEEQEGRSRSRSSPWKRCSTCTAGHPGELRR
ncbi:MAG: thiamine pyrophosphate-dependent enzyme [Planctomycetota bacterium]